MTFTVTRGDLQRREWSKNKKKRSLKTAWLIQNLLFSVISIWGSSHMKFNVWPWPCSWSFKSCIAYKGTSYFYTFCILFSFQLCWYETNLASHSFHKLFICPISFFRNHLLLACRQSAWVMNCLFLSRTITAWFKKNHQSVIVLEFPLLCWCFLFLFLLQAEEPPARLAQLDKRRSAEREVAG